MNFASKRGTGKYMIVVPLSDLKFLFEFAAGGAGTSNRRQSMRSDMNFRTVLRTNVVGNGPHPRT
jgi:hypothetical protein